MRQYASTGKVEDWGRVGAAAGGGAVSGAMTAVNPGVGLATVMGSGAASNAAGGVATRLIESGGKDAGTLTDVVVDASVGAATGGIVKGGSSLLRKVVPKKPPAPPASRKPVGEAARDIETPYGPAKQSIETGALEARQQVADGATLYRIGRLGRSNGTEAQFWSLEHPLSPGYASRYGIPPRNVEQADFIATARLKSGSEFVTRPAPPVDTNPGGGIEVVVDAGGIELRGFSMP